MKISLDTKIAALLDEYPEMEDTLIEISPVFSNLRNPVLCRTAAKIADIRHAAKVAGLSPDHLLHLLCKKAGQEADVIQNTMMNKNRLIIGADPFPPYQYYDANGVLQGTDYEKIKTAGIKAGFELEFLIENWVLIEQKFSQKKLDAVFQLPKTPEREKQYLFSKLLRNGVTEVITGHPALEIYSINDIEMQKYTFGVVEGISSGEDVKALDKKCKISYPNNEDLLAAIGKQEVHLGIFDQGVKQFLMEKLSVKNIRVINALTFIRPLFMAFHEKEIKEAFDRYL